MKVKDFLEEFSYEDFPSLEGPWIDFDCFDPPFTLTELKTMAKQKIIILNIANKKFCLTMEATKIKDELR